MEAIKLREILLKKISEADESLLYIVNDAIENYSHIHSDVVSEPMTIEQYNAEIAEAEADFASGDVFTHEEAAEIIKRWKRE